MSLSDYKKKELRQHIYDTPDTYVGGVDLIEDKLPVYEDGKIIDKTIIYIPAIYSIYNEILVNVRDQIVRLIQNKSKNRVTIVKIDYDSDTKMWTIHNDGEGIDIADHPTEKTEDGKSVNIVEMIFGMLLTSKNYDKDEKKIVGGKNGYGAKLTNIFSTYFRIETVDETRKLKYIQEFRNNMTEKSLGKISNSKSKSYTRVSWIVDFERFGIKDYGDDMMKLMIRRIYDICGTTPSDVKFYYNRKLIKLNSFEQYIQLYLNDEKIVYFDVNGRWRVGVATGLTDRFEHYSFVNGISTFKGGKHVDYVAKQIITGIVDHVKKRYKTDINPSYVKNYMKIFIDSIIENPSFDSQTKERLITPASKFGSKCLIDEKMIKKIIDGTDIVDKTLSFAEFKLNKEAKKTNGAKVNKLRNIPKLDDANLAGTKKSQECTLILTEGDSAKTMAISGLSVIGRDTYGVFPLKGKILNVKEATKKQIMGNTELTNIKKIMGLVEGKTYKDTKSLRYGHIMILTDQDHDGSHIKGLLINLFHTLWPSLLQIPDFIICMITPIVKCVNKTKVEMFYNLTDYEAWKSNKTSTKWKTKYYKGLGTSSAQEAREYFKNMKTNRYSFTETSDSKIDLAFKKDLADDRKQWLYGYDPDKIINNNETDISFDKFVDNELIHFSNSDTKRSIGSICDGLKPSQRKILFCAFKRKLYSEIKVAQFAGYVSEHSAYHHGEMSLQGAIIGMAQTFVGSNNINLLKPNGQFGTRILGGHDSASPRYIHTELNRVIDHIYIHSDFDVVTYLDDDGVSVEPEYYVPIIPMVLVNGMKGIGTGFSTTIPCFNPIDIIKNIQNKLDDKPYVDMIPWYNEFNGKIEKINDKQYITKGVYNIVGKSTLKITELPIGKWTQNYKEFLESLIYDKTKKQKFYILDYSDNSTDTRVEFLVKVEPNILSGITCNVDKNIDSIEEYFKLSSTIKLTNLHLYDERGVVKRYDTIYDILDNYYIVRLDYYEKRKTYQTKKIENDLEHESNRMRFITDVVEDRVVVFKNKRENIIKYLVDNKYVKYHKSYNYLIDLSIVNFTNDKIEELQKHIDKLNHELETLKSTITRDMWKNELGLLIKKLK